MSRRSWLAWDYWMRVSHLYTGLFLVPWMTVYAISAFCLNHPAWFASVQPQWKTIREAEFKPGPDFPQSPEERAQVLVREVELEGPLQSISGDDNQVTIYRPCAAGWYRVVWQRSTGRIVVDKQLPFSFYSFVNQLHFQRRFDRPNGVHLCWAVIVDAVAISTLIWIVSGIYLWARRPRKRLGGVCLAAGCVVFAVLAALLCR